MSDVSVVMLKNGTEVIGEITTDVDDMMEMKNPVQIVYRMTSAAAPTVTFVKFMTYADITHFNFNKSDILILAPATAAAEMYYDKYSKVLYPSIEDIELEEQQDELTSEYDDLLEQLDPSSMTLQ